MFLIKPLLHLLSWLPLPLLHAMAIPLSWLIRLLPWRGHKLVHINLEVCFPELSPAERRALYRRNLVEMTRLALEAGAVWYWPRRRLERRIRQQGWEQVEEAAREGRGVLLVGAHFGSWEVLPLWISMRRPFTALYKAPRNPALDAEVTRSRERFGATLVASGSPAMRKLLAGLRRGEVIGLLADQQPKQGEGVFVNFFGRPALTMTLINRLTRCTGCRVFFASAQRCTLGRGWQLDFVPADPAIAGEDAEAAACVMKRWLETTVQKSPAQYLWSYKRFSIQPPGVTSPYPSRASSQASRP